MRKCNANCVGGAHLVRLVAARYPDLPRRPGGPRLQEFVDVQLAQAPTACEFVSVRCSQKSERLCANLRADAAAVSATAAQVSARAAATHRQVEAAVMRVAILQQDILERRMLLIVRKMVGGSGP